MTRSFFVFLGTFTTGALIALVTRAALFEPHATREASPVGGGDYAQMVTNTLAPHNAAPVADPHAGHGPAGAPAPIAATAAPAQDGDKPVNTVCAMCGMDVDPKLPTATYQGRTIGFGCRMCLPRFNKDPDRWGPLYLRNEVVRR